MGETLNSGIREETTVVFSNILYSFTVLFLERFGFLQGIMPATSTRGKVEDIAQAQEERVRAEEAEAEVDAEYARLLAEIERMHMEQEKGPGWKLRTLV